MGIAAAPRIWPNAAPWRPANVPIVGRRASVSLAVAAPFLACPYARTTGNTTGPETNQGVRALRARTGLPHHPEPLHIVSPSRYCGEFLPTAARFDGPAGYKAHQPKGERILSPPRMPFPPPWLGRAPAATSRLVSGTGHPPHIGAA